MNPLAVWTRHSILWSWIPGRADTHSPLDQGSAAVSADIVETSATRELAVGRGVETNDETGAERRGPGARGRTGEPGPGSGGGRQTDPAPVHCRVPAEDPRRSRTPYPTGRAWPAAPARGPAFLAHLGTAPRLAAGTEAREAWRKAGRLQPSGSRGPPARGEGGAPRERAHNHAHDSGTSGKGCRAAGIHPHRREGLLMAGSSLAQHVGVAPACRAPEVCRGPSTLTVRLLSNSGSRAGRPPGRRMTTRACVLDVFALPRFVDRSPVEGVATLLDEGQYPCPERTMHHILAAERPVRERHRRLNRPRRARPGTGATAPNRTHRGTPSAPASSSASSAAPSQGEWSPGPRVPHSPPPGRPGPGRHQGPWLTLHSGSDTPMTDTRPAQLPAGPGLSLRRPGSVHRARRHHRRIPTRS